MVWFVCGIALLWSVLIYNKLVRLSHQLANSFAQIAVQLQRRYDLIPNLVNTVKGYLAHEQQTLTAVIAARDHAASCLQALNKQPRDDAAVSALNVAESQLSHLLGKIQLTVEAYPELKADSVMQQLAEELVSTENRVAFARQAFNDDVLAFNSYKQMLPNVIIAKQFGFAKDAKVLETPNSDSNEQAPIVKF